jgi:ribosomal protein L16 Arg81 hydroxylase
VHAQGDVSWEIANTFENDDDDVTSLDLTVGDLLYIPKGLMHRAIPKTKRISISVPVAERKANEGALKTQDRTYYDFA